MSAPYNNVSLFGIGGLITQRKIFQVPAYQRDFAWSRDIVEQFVYDITSALEKKEHEYFVGMIVLTGPHKEAWQLLEGQQRLATTLLMYSAIQRVLSRLNQEDAAEQIKSEFLVIRKLRGEKTPRLILNDVNQNLFSKIILDDYSQSELRHLLAETYEAPSNKRLIEAALICETLIAQYAREGEVSVKESSDLLFDLADYLESKVKVACFDVSSEENAFTIFQTLNNRGVALSVVDLIKSYLFNKAGRAELEVVRQDWTNISLNIGNRSLEEFLRVFWASRYGNVRTTDLFEHLKSKVEEEGSSSRLLRDLANTSSYFAALHDPAHEMWSDFNPESRKYIQTLNLLGSSQVKPIILSAIDLFNGDEMVKLLWVLLVVTIRNQTADRRGAGKLSRHCGPIANEIHKGRIQSAESVLERLQGVITSDEVFYNDFLSFSESKASRASYYLLQLELTYRRKRGYDTSSFQDMSDLYKTLYVDHIFPIKFNPTTYDLISQGLVVPDELLQRLGNQCLIENHFNLSINEPPFVQKAKEYYARSEVLLTRRIVEESDIWSSEQIERRQAFLAELAVETWTVRNMA